MYHTIVEISEAYMYQIGILQFIHMYNMSLGI